MLRSALVQPSQDDGCVSCGFGRRGFGIADQGIQRREAVWHVVSLALARPGEQRSGRPRALSLATHHIAREEPLLEVHGCFDFSVVQRHTLGDYNQLVIVVVPAVDHRDHNAFGAFDRVIHA